MRVIKMNADKNRPMKIEKEILYRYFNGDAGPEEEKKIRQYIEVPKKTGRNIFGRGNSSIRLF